MLHGTHARPMAKLLECPDLEWDGRIKLISVFGIVFLYYIRQINKNFKLIFL